MSPGTPAPQTAQDVIDFWLEAGPPKWFAKDADFDRRFKTRFLATHESATRGELAHWQDNAAGALALVLLLDQFPRNAFRGSARMFATDARARVAADTALQQGLDSAVAPQLRAFFYMPFMHSEALADQERCVALCRAANDDNTLHFALEHRDIIARFGRFPHRNAVLGRESSDDERRFLADGGFGG